MQHTVTVIADWILKKFCKKIMQRPFFIYLYSTAEYGASFRET